MLPGGSAFAPGGAMAGPQIQRGADGLASGMTLPPPQATEQALAMLAQLLSGQQPQQRQVELLREQGRIAGARITEPDGAVRHVGFARGADGRIAAARPVMPPGSIAF